jgi:17beta-estradiol 17-dehydrogenase / very-long-chain 3-oxoacyl-CoA reductase
VLLVARNPQSLSETAVDIGQSYICYHTSQLTCSNIGLESRYKVSTLTHSIDFSKSNDDAYDGLTTVCDGLDIGVLGMFVCFVAYLPMLIVDSE